MAEANIIPQAITGAPVWRRVAEIADLVEIFDQEIQICTWRRQIDPTIETYLSALHQTRELQVMEVLSPDARPKLDCLPEGPGRAPLIDDLSFLLEVIFDLLGCCEIGMRFARVGRAMCPGWHFDRVGIRLVCTYQGPGTQWLDNQDIDRRNFHSGRLPDDMFIQAVPGEIVLLKGALWQGNEAFGAVHRSPELGPIAAPRTLITFDPLWRE